MSEWIRPLRGAAWIGTLCVLSLAVVEPAHAVEEIHDMLWFPRDFTSPHAIDGSGVFVSFEGRITETDLQNGLTFSVAAQDAEGGLAVVLPIADAFDNPPTVGTLVTAGFTFRIECHPLTGLLHARIANGAFSFCHPDDGALVQLFDNVEHVASGVISDPFGFAILDENGEASPDPTPTNGFTCGVGLPMSAPTKEQTIDVVSLRKSRELDRILEDGDSGTIGVYFDAEGTQCTGTITPDQPGRIYIIANTNGLTGCGVAAAEFRFEGIPDSWVTVSAPNPEMLAIGDPFADGVTCAFPCAQPENGKYLLYTVVVFATDDEDDLTFSLEMRNPSSSPAFNCPQLLMCDTPYFTKLCVETIPCYVNTNAPKSCAIPVSVTKDTWSRVKALYR